MRMTFLGTAAGRPTKERNVTSIAMDLPSPANQFWLFDVGEGTQHQLLKFGFKLNRLAKIFITHLHGDHIYGLPGLLGSRGFFEGNVPLTIYGPKGIADYLKAVFALTDARPQYELHIVEVEAGCVFDESTFKVIAGPLDHRVACFGYRLEEKPRQGALRKDVALAKGVPNGPLLGQLKRGENVTLPNGQCVYAHEVLEEAKRGRIVTILGDTRPCAHAVELAADADVLVHEATYAMGMEEKANEYGHSTSQQAVQTALQAKAKQLIMTHFSNRLHVEDVEQMVMLAQQQLPNSFAAFDGYSTFVQT